MWYVKNNLRELLQIANKGSLGGQRSHIKVNVSSPFVKSKYPEISDGISNIWLERSLRFKDDLDVKVEGHCELTTHVFDHKSKMLMLIMTKYTEYVYWTPSEYFEKFRFFEKQLEKI